MSVNKETVFAGLAIAVKARGQRVLERFRLNAVAGVRHPMLLLMLEDVNGYWNDLFRPALASFSCEAVGGVPQAADNVSLMITLMSAGLGST